MVRSVSKGTTPYRPASPLQGGHTRAELRRIYIRRRVTAVAVLAGVVVVLVIAVAGGGGPATRTSPAASGASASSGGSKHATNHPTPVVHHPATPVSGLHLPAALAHRALDEERAVAAALRHNAFVAEGGTGQREIALTFDDGPSPYTPAILRVLERMHAPATFFVVGQQLNAFATGLRDEINAGFEIGDHTENHAWLIRLNPAGQYGQIHDDAVRINRLGAPFPQLFRPPYGAYNAQTMKLIGGLKMMMVLWSIDPGDWRRPGVRAILANVLSHSRPGGIVELHDGGGDRTQTIDALPAIINGLRQRHYKLVSVAQLVRDDPPPRHQQVPGVGAA
jgi:peptidoglycan/xylan/chitin deacetylase (PgdA/CDA1 family)